MVLTMKLTSTVEGPMLNSSRNSRTSLVVVVVVVVDWLLELRRYGPAATIRSPPSCHTYQPFSLSRATYKMSQYIDRKEAQKSYRPKAGVRLTFSLSPENIID